MSKKAGGRFGYLSTLTATELPKRSEPDKGEPSGEAGLTTVPKGQGRMEQDRTQLNIRIPTLLKRRAGAKAMLEGRTLAEVVEEFLQTYVSELQ